MEIMEYNSGPDDRNSKLQRAKKRVEQIKGFYVHLMVYLIINIFIIILLGYARGGGEGFELDWPNFSTAFFWGIGLLFHALHVFGFNLFLGKDWEKRQIQKFIEEDKREAEKYKNK